MYGLAVRASHSSGPETTCFVAFFTYVGLDITDHDSTRLLNFIPTLMTGGNGRPKFCRTQGTVPTIAEDGARSGAASMWRHLPSGPDQRVSTRVRTMWTGVGATLARDVPFSAIYWQLLEPTRRALLPADGSDSSQSQVRRTQA